MHIRYFVDTSTSATGQLALAFCKALVRLAPVRLVTYGDLLGGWTRYDDLLITPMEGSMINVVCMEPDRWVWKMRVAAPASMAPRGPAIPAGGVEVMEDVRELYTMGARNVLIAPCLPRSKAELGTALRYEALIVSTAHDHERWSAIGAEPRLIPVPVRDHAQLSGAVLP